MLDYPTAMSLSHTASYDAFDTPGTSYLRPVSADIEKRHRYIELS